MKKIIAAVLFLVLSINPAAAWTHVQSAIGPDNNGSPSGTTLALAFASPISATRNAVSGAVVFESDIPADLVSVVSDKGDIGVIVDDLNSASNPTDGETAASFYFPTLTAGAKTFTATFNVSTSFFRMELDEDDPGVGNAFSLDKHSAAYQNVSAIGGGGANIVNSGSATTTANGDLIKGFAANTGGTPTISAGTSPNAFTVRNLSTGGTVVLTMISEDFVQSTAGSVAATFGYPGAGGASTCSLMMALKIGAAPPPTGGTRRSLTGVGN